MNVEIFADSHEFLQHTRSFLAQDDPVNLPLFTSVRTLKHLSRRKRNKPFLATVESEDSIQAVAVHVPPRPLYFYSPLEAVMPAFSRLQPHLPPTETLVTSSHLPHLTTTQITQIYTQPAISNPPSPTANFRSANADDYMLIIEWVSDMTNVGKDPEVVQMVVGELMQNGEVYLWQVDNEPVSMVATGLRTDAGISLAQLYTPPTKRRQGYATALVAALSQQLLAKGWHYCAIMLENRQSHLATLAENAGFSLHGQLIEYRL
jgi:GNAT superfamily N-acetyltransferase